MNLSIQQALRYNAAAELNKAFTHSAVEAPVHLLVAADAQEEQGQEGIADVLRHFGRTTEEPDTGHLWRVGNLIDAGPHLTVGDADNNIRFGLGAYGRELGVKRLGATLSVSGGGRSRILRRLLTPEQARELVDRMPNKDELNGYIDRHFPTAQQPTDN